jgi:hypothetical protein
VTNDSLDHLVGDGKELRVHRPAAVSGIMGEEVSVASGTPPPAPQRLAVAKVVFSQQREQAQGHGDEHGEPEGD